MRSLSLIAIAVLPLFLSSCTKEKGEPIPRLVKDELVKADDQYQVKGSIHNPSKHPMKDVKVRYLVWEKFKGTTDKRVGIATKRSGGEVNAEIKYLPAGETVEFTAVGSEGVTAYLEIVPDPLKAEIEAKWAD